jgi:hypothetical protein
MAQKKFQGGFYAGGTTSQISGDGLGGWNKFGLNAGAFVQVAFGEKSGLSLGIDYAMRGSKKPADTNNGDYLVFEYRLNYIDLPVLYKQQFGEKIELGIGPVVGLLTKQKTWDNSTNNEIDLQYPFNKLDFSGAFTASYLITPKLFFELRSQSSLLPARKAPDKGATNKYYTAGNYNQMLQLNIGWKF